MMLRPHHNGMAPELWHGRCGDCAVLRLRQLRERVTGYHGDGAGGGVSVDVRWRLMAVVHEGYRDRSIVGTFRSRSGFERAVKDLRSNGFSGGEITISMKDFHEAERMSDQLGIVDARTTPRWLGDNNMLLGVECGDRCDEATRILSEHGAENICWATITAVGEARASRARAGAGEEAAAAPLFEEEVVLEKCPRRAKRARGSSTRPKRP